MTRRHPVAFAIVCLALTAAVGILLRPLTPIDETRYLAVAWEMHLTHDWWVPSRNFALYSDKPPLLFWAINLVWMFTGVSEFAARLVVPAFACAAIWLTAGLARRLWPEDGGVGGRAALALAGLAFFALAGSLTMFDVPLAVAVLLGLIALHNGGAGAAAGRSGLRPWAGFGAAVALGVLTKGPVILFHLLPAAVLLPLWSARPLAGKTLALHTGFGLLVALGLVSVWLVPAAIMGGPEYRDAILWHQSAGRVARSFAHARPWWFYLALLPALTFPLGWSPALWHAGRAADWRRDRGLRLCLIWTFGALILFSLTSGKQAHYLVPEMPALALIAARIGKAPRFGLQPAAIGLALLAGAAMLAGSGVLPPGRLGSSVEPRSAFLAWALLIAAVCWLALQRQGLIGAMMLSLGMLLATNLLIGVTDLSRIYSTHPIAARIAPHQPDGLAHVGGRYSAEFNFAGRLTLPVATPPDRAALEAWIASHPNGLIVGRLDQSDLSWPPQETIRFRDHQYGIWNVSASLFPLKQEP